MIKDNFSEALYYAKGKIQIKNCLLCNRRISSAVRSHIIPQFILKKLSFEGRIIIGSNLVEKIEDCKVLGVRNAMIVKLLCEKCDNEYFKIYENIKALDSFNIDNKDIRKKKLVAISIKSNLAHIYFKKTSFEIEKECIENVISANQLDIKQHINLVKYYKKFYNTTNSPFYILYEETLPYFAGISCQALITPNYDLEGNEMFISNMSNMYDPVKYLNIVVLPYSNKTMILIYYNKNDSSHFKQFKQQFEALSKGEKIHLLFILIITYTEYFCINPNLAELINKDKKIAHLYSGTNHYNSKTYYQIIKEAMLSFRTYNNYICNKYDIESLNNK